MFSLQGAWWYWYGRPFSYPWAFVAFCAAGQKANTISSTHFDTLLWKWIKVLFAKVLTKAWRNFQSEKWMLCGIKTVTAVVTPTFTHKETMDTHFFNSFVYFQNFYNFYEAGKCMGPYDLHDAENTDETTESRHKNIIYCFCQSFWDCHGIWQILD